MIPAQPESWLDQYGGLSDNTSALTFIDEIDLPALTVLLKCERCGHSTAGDGSYDAECWVGQCVEIRCKNCDHRWGGWGPVGCACQRRHPRIRRIRQAYRARRR